MGIGSRFLWYLAFCFTQIAIPATLNGQAYISGFVECTNGNPLPNAAVTITFGDNQFRFRYTDNSGQFRFGGLPPDSYLMKTSLLGFEKDTRVVALSLKDTSIVIRLNEKVLLLDEVVITGRSPVVVKQDTIVFDVYSFYTGREEVLMDLLNNIPGFTVDAAGVARYGNQEIKYVLIDGDNMFDRGYSILTKNMPIRPIETVELLTNYSEDKVLKGLNENGSHAINLRIKSDFRNSVFGEGKLAAGVLKGVTLPNYVNVNAMSLQKRSKVFAVISQNNVGSTHIGDLGSLGEKVLLEDEPEIGDDQVFERYVSISPINESNIGNRRLNFNNERVGSLSSLLTLNPKTNVRLTGAISTDHNKFFREKYQQFI